MVKIYDDPPAWFLKKDYSYLGGLDAAGGLDELERCLHLENEGAKRKAGEPTFEQERESLFGGKIPDGIIPRYVGPPAVRAIDKTDPESLGPLASHILTLQICLASNDADIMAGVERELSRAREQYPSVVRKPGPQVLNARIDKAQFDLWQNRKIIEISELYDWASREGRALSSADLGRWLFAQNYSDPNNTVCKALETRKHAFKMIPALWAQVNVTANSA
ncbi:hypothetical protein [Methylocapsa palsarum]|uniref:Uncharacterized protein n=1 Tax=Methylocapsa palsarum TaxID=1612308 RepID=A0A1I3W6W1_9HYPH|nr:hypothetical protein [Methylocapsa palsarum]SFK03328.1 hypothetical protein SAMN05444581_101396 [Methylocapsa palsarum]